MPLLQGYISLYSLIQSIAWISGYQDYVIGVSFGDAEEPMSRSTRSEPPTTINDHRGRRADIALKWYEQPYYYYSSG